MVFLIGRAEKKTLLEGSGFGNTWISRNFTGLYQRKKLLVELNGTLGQNSRNATKRYLLESFIAFLMVIDGAGRDLLHRLPPLSFNMDAYRAQIWQSNAVDFGLFYQL